MFNSFVTFIILLCCKFSLTKSPFELLQEALKNFLMTVNETKQYLLIKNCLFKLINAYRGLLITPVSSICLSNSSLILYNTSFIF